MTPLVFAAEIVLVLGLAAAAAATALGHPPGPLPALQKRLLRDMAGAGRRQAEMASDLGLTTGWWLALRAGAVLGGSLTGAVSGIPAVALIGAIGGLVGLPWALAGAIARRRLRVERALTSLALALRNLMRQSNLALDRALREAARSAPPELVQVLAPLNGDTSVADALCEIARRARSPLADLLVTALLVARTHNPMALVNVTDEVLLPLMEQAVAIQEENLATVAQQRAAAVAIGLIMAVLFVAVVRVPSMHAFYEGAPGQLILLAVAAMYAGLVWAIGQVARPIRWVEWDIDAIRAEAEALVA